MQLSKLIFKLTNVKFQCNLDRENVYRRRNDLSLFVFKQTFSSYDATNENPNARQNKLTNNHVSLRPREHVETGFEKSRKGVFTRDHAKTTHGKFQVDLSGLLR